MATTVDTNGPAETDTAGIRQTDPGCGGPAGCCERSAGRLSWRAIVVASLAGGALCLLLLKTFGA